MPTVRFAWNAQLVDVRRQACPKARWDKSTRAWFMTAMEAETFIAAAHARLEFARMATEVQIDGNRRIIGFSAKAMSAAT